MNFELFDNMNARQIRDALKAFPSSQRDAIIDAAKLERDTARAARQIKIYQGKKYFYESRIEKLYDGISIKTVQSIDLSDTQRKMRNIIDGNPKWVGVMTNMSGGHEYSKNVNSFYLNTGLDGKTGNVVYQDWLDANFEQREEFFNRALINSDWRLAGFIAAPAKKPMGKMLITPCLAESYSAVTMYYIYNRKTGEVRRLIADESIWLSLGNWGTCSNCARLAISHAGISLDSDKALWGTVRGLLKSRVKSR